MNLAFRRHDQPVTLVASCLGDGDTGGGLLYHDGQAWVAIDDVSTTGLFVCGDELIRILWAPSQVAERTSILHYSTDGYVRQVTVGGLTDPHDVLWDRQQYVAVSSFQNSVLWITTEGTVVRRFQPVRGEDCWHLNSLLIHEQVLYATAFGRFDEPRGWVEHQRDGTGVLFRLDTGVDAVVGLDCPHTPRFASGHWFICNAATSDLRIFSAGGKLVARIPLRDWVRGLAIADEYLLVGESINRQLTDEVRGASVAVLDRNSHTVLARLRLPYREIYDLVLISAKLLEGVLRAPGPRLIASCPPQITLLRPST
jgi:uncharacterized protein (TIGR03032 family)